jgi:PAS domain S-box-containing protein
VADMSSTKSGNTMDEPAGRCNLLDEPEQDSLLRLTKLVEHIFHVPFAYMALLGADLTVITRIGSGSEHWASMKTYPLAAALSHPIVWPDPSGAPAPGFICGDVRFAAGVPLQSSNGLELGLLAIADVKPRPEFSRQDHELLSEVAGVLAEKMELRLMACQARQAESCLREAENRFRNIADSVPVMLIYSGVDGGSSFVNKAWLEFTGRSFAEELGDGYAETFHPDYRERTMETYWDAFQERRSLTIEFPMRRHDGDYRWMEARGVPRFHDDGTFAGYIGCLIDLTDQRSAVPEARKDAAELSI